SHMQCSPWLFFFSSRRRHTSFSRDWSSDVCSSDLVMAQWWFDQFTGPEEIGLSEFITQVENGEFEKVELLARSNQVYGRVDGSRLPPDGFEFSASYPDGYEGELTELLRNSGTPIETDPQPP